MTHIDAMLIQAGKEKRQRELREEFSSTRKFWDQALKDAAQIMATVSGCQEHQEQEREAWIREKMLRDAGFYSRAVFIAHQLVEYAEAGRDYLREKR